MNSRFLFRWIVLLSLALAGVTLGIGLVNAARARDAMRETLLARSRAELKEATELLHNDLVLGNFRGARKYLEGLRAAHTIQAYWIRPIGEAPGLELGSTEVSPPGILSEDIVVPVLFSPGGMAWGDVRYRVGLEEIRVISGRLFRSALLAAALTAVICLGVLWILAQSLIRAVHGLYPLLDQMSQGESFGPVSPSLNAIWKPLVSVMESTQRTLKDYQAEISRAQQARVLGDLASQVAHDIRSPLASLIAIAHDAPDLREEARVQLRGAVNRIRDIANSLLVRSRQANSWSEPRSEETTRKKPDAAVNAPDRPGKPGAADGPGGPGKPGGADGREGPEGPYGPEGFAGDPRSQALSTEPFQAELLPFLIESVISQKRLQLHQMTGVRIEGPDPMGSFGLFSSVQPTELARIVSNLIDNAVEAVGSQGLVSVSMEGGMDWVSIDVSDNGKGIPAAILPRIGERGFSYGKKGAESGSGLGVYHAKVTLESWGGALAIHSIEGKGTSITIRLKPEQPPSWYAGRLEISLPTTIVILDDDPGIHAVWDRKLENIASSSAERLSILHFHSPEEVLQWYRANVGADQGVILLFDQEIMGSRLTGLDAIEMLGMPKNAILVTSRSDEATLRERCQKLGVRILPKTMVPFAPVEVLRS